MNKIRLSSLHYVLAAGFLFVFAKFWEPGLGVSSTSYGAEAFSFFQTGSFFYPRLGIGLLDPFVDHPYLALWIDAFFFRIFGASAQTIRLLSSLLGLGVMFSLYQVTRARFHERAALFSVVGLFLVNMYMNFNSSGWLDMPMIGFTWLGFYFLEKDDRQSRGGQVPPRTFAILGGLGLAAAFLVKGIGALPILPILVWYACRQIRRRPGVVGLVALSAALPLLLFTYFHERSQGFFFWTAYLHRQFGALNQPAKEDVLAHFWYLKESLRIGHVVTLAGAMGLYRMWTKGSAHRDLGILITSVVLLHFLAYSLSSRHFDQYVIPLIPWLALAGAPWVASLPILQVDTERAAKILFRIAIFYFVVVDLVPVRVHSSSGEPYRAFTKDLEGFKDDRHVYILGVREDQDTWEDVASYVAWYWKREPELVEFRDMLEHLSVEGSKSSGVVEQIFLDEKTRALWAQYPKVQVCFENADIMLLTNENLCPREIQRQRFIESRAQKFAR